MHQVYQDTEQNVVLDVHSLVKPAADELSVFSFPRQFALSFLPGVLLASWFCSDRTGSKLGNGRPNSLRSAEDG